MMGVLATLFYMRGSDRMFKAAVKVKPESAVHSYGCYMQKRKDVALQPGIGSHGGRIARSQPAC